MQLYNSIYEIPLYNWEQFSRTSNPEYLLNKDSESDRLKDKFIKLFNFKHGVKLFTDEEIQGAYYSIYDELMDMTEARDSMEEWSSIVIELMDARVRYIDGDESEMNNIKHLEELLNEMSAENSGSDPIKNRMIVQKLYGISINPKEVTLAEFIKITDIVKENNKTVKNSTEDEED